VAVRLRAGATTTASEPVSAGFGLVTVSPSVCSSSTKG
jgi:hypothetical protein